VTTFGCICRQIVAAAHLRPLDKEDKESLGPAAAATNKVIWNSTASCSKQPEDEVENMEKSGKRTVALEPEEIPTRIEEFVNHWKKLDTEDGKFAYLQKLLLRHPHPKKSSCPLKQVFAYEVPANILPDILEVLDSKSIDMDSMLMVLKVLQIVAESKRLENF